ERVVVVEAEVAGHADPLGLERLTDLIIRHVTLQFQDLLADGGGIFGIGGDLAVLQLPPHDAGRPDAKLMLQLLEAIQIELFLRDLGEDIRLRKLLGADDDLLRPGWKKGQKEEKNRGEDANGASDHNCTRLLWAERNS